MERTDQPVVTNTTRARAGVTGHNVRTVLYVSVAVVVAAFGLLLLLYFG